jgi:hypothetical protein
MRHLTERLMQTAFLLVGIPFSGLLCPRRHPKINSMKCDQIPKLRARRLAARAHNTNWDLELALGQERVNPRWVNNTIPRPALIGPHAFASEQACSPGMVTLVGPPAMLTREAAAAAGEPRRPI